MKPAEPVTRTLLNSSSSRRLTLPGHEFFQGQLRAEREEVPVQVFRKPSCQLEVRHPKAAVEPDRRDLRDRATQPPGFGNEFEPDFETRVGLDPDFANKLFR